VLFLTGDNTSYVYAWDGNDGHGLGSNSQFADPGDRYNYQSLAIGRNPGTEIDKDLIVTTRAGWVHCYPTANLDQLATPRWSRHLSLEQLSTPAVGNVCGGTANEIVVTTEWNGTGIDSVFVLRESDGETLLFAQSSDFRFRRNGDAPPAGPALADIDGDGREEIIIADHVSGAGSAVVGLTLRIFDWDWNDQLVCFSATDSMPYSQRNTEDSAPGGKAHFPVGTPIVGDFDYDQSNRPDILVASNQGAIFAFQWNPQANPHLKAKEPWPLLLPDVAREPALYVLDPEDPSRCNLYSLVVQCQDGWLHVFDLPLMRTNCDLQLPLPEWPAYGKDLGNTRGPSVWSFSEGPPRDDLVGMEAPVTLGNVTPIPTVKGQRVTLEAAGAQDVTLEIYDVAGRLVRRLLKGRIESGTTVVDWNGNDEDGTRAESGIYWYRLRWSTGVEARRVVVLH